MENEDIVDLLSSSQELCDFLKHLTSIGRIYANKTEKGLEKERLTLAEEKKIIGYLLHSANFNIFIYEMEYSSTSLLSEAFISDDFSKFMESIIEEHQLYYSKLINKLLNYSNEKKGEIQSE